jgi:hypothetical protein
MHAPCAREQSQSALFTFLSREKKIKTQPLLGSWSSGEKEPKMTADAAGVLNTMATGMQGGGEF